MLVLVLKNIYWFFLSSFSTGAHVALAGVCARALIYFSHCFSWLSRLSSAPASRGERSQPLNPAEPLEELSIPVATQLHPVININPFSFIARSLFISTTGT